MAAALVSGPGSKGGTPTIYHRQGPTSPDVNRRKITMITFRPRTRLRRGPLRDARTHGDGAHIPFAKHLFPLICLSGLPGNDAAKTTVSHSPMTHLLQFERTRVRCRLFEAGRFTKASCHVDSTGRLTFCGESPPCVRTSMRGPPCTSAARPQPGAPICRSSRAAATATRCVSK